MGILELGFYCGLATLYPYGPVYCPTEECRGQCYGVYVYQSKSAPLPTPYKHCVGVDMNLSDPKNWHQWKPRPLSEQRAQMLSAISICFWEDRGEPKDINDLEREPVKDPK